jgi:hypothetical protein
MVLEVEEKISMRLRELFESVKRPVVEAGPSIGRKYQHIEDLVFTNGSVGGLHAVERMRDMSEQGGSIELKWDGSPVVYWGRDDRGRFMLIPKNAWEYLKRGKTVNSAGVSTLMYEPADIEKFILSTGKSGDIAVDSREQYARQLSGLWRYFESVSPAKGFIEGGLLFYPGIKPDGDNAMPTVSKEGTYDFTPNITTFHIPVDSELGRKIKQATVMVAATGYYPSLGSGDEQRLPDAEQLSNKDVIVQGTTYVQDAPEFDTTELDRAEQFIEKHAEAIDGFLAGQPGLSKPGDVLYKFYNQNLRLSGVKSKFEQWVRSEFPTGGKAQKILSHPGLELVLDAVEMLTNAKMEMISALSSGSHGGIKQTKPEGYAQAHPGRQFKRDLPGQFVKAIDQGNWTPRKD